MLTHFWKNHLDEKDQELCRFGRSCTEMTLDESLGNELREIFQPSNDVEWAKVPKKIPYMVHGDLEQAY